MAHHPWSGFARTVISIAVAMAAAPVLAQNKALWSSIRIRFREEHRYGYSFPAP